MKYKIIKTFEDWAKIQAIGTYEQDFKNGELWYFNGDMWYLSHLKLPMQELKKVVEYYKNPEKI